MCHFQVNSMGARLLLLFVICQTVITASLGGVSLPFPDVIGNVTPIKPKPLSSPTISSSDALTIAKSALMSDGKSRMPKLFSSASRGSICRDFSSPLAFTSSSRALPVPKIDSSSISDVKIPERLREKFLSPTLRNAPRNAKPGVCTPDVTSHQTSLPYKYQFSSSPSKPSPTLPTYSSWDTYSSTLNKLSSLPSIQSLPMVPVESIKSSGTDLYDPPYKRHNVLASLADSSLSTTEAKKPLFSELISTETLLPVSSSCSLPYPLFYESIYLPGVKTPSESLNDRQISQKRTSNFDFPSQGSHKLLSLQSLGCDTKLNTFPHRNEPCLPTYFDSAKAAEIPKPINTIQLPRTSSKVPVSAKAMLSAQDAFVKNPWSLQELNSGSRLEPPEPLLSSVNLRCLNDRKTTLTSLPYLHFDKITDFKCKPCDIPKINPSVVSLPPSYLNSPLTPLMPASPSFPTIDVSSNRIKSFDYSKNIGACDIPPTCGYVKTIEGISNNDDLSNNFQTCVKTKNIPSLEQINLSSPFGPKIASYQHPLEYISNPFNYSPPRIPLVPISTISSGTSAWSPTTCCPSRASSITSTPISHINQFPASSFAQSTSKIVSSINSLVSNITQNILSSFKSYINSASQNISQRPTCTTQSNPYDNSKFTPRQTSVLTNGETDNVCVFTGGLEGNPVNTVSILPAINSPSDCVNPPAVDIHTILSSDESCKRSSSEVCSRRPLSIPSAQPLAAPVLSSTSLITFSTPQLCPSYLPSPTLPSYPIIEPPFYMEAPVIKISSSKKDSDMEKLIELVLLAEILNNDESFDWDDLDTLLAFLAVS